jgi:hypothetical protein
MEELRVPRRRIPVRMILDDGRTLEADLFVAPIGPDGGPERLADRLNDPHDEFVPVASGGDRFVLNKSGIVLVHLSGGPEEAGIPETFEGHEAPVRLSLTGGLGLIGRLPIAMPPERSRVLDYLNAAERFVPILGDGQVTLVQRRFIVSVRGEEPPLT